MYLLCVFQALYLSVQFSCSVMSDSLRPHESQHARPPCPSPTPGVHSDSRPLSQWCHPAISSSVFVSKCYQWCLGQDWKRSVQSQRKAMPKNVQTTAQLHSSHTLAKECSKFSKPGFNSTWTMNFQIVQAGFRKSRGARDQIANIRWIIEKAREF